MRESLQCNSGFWPIRAPLLVAVVTVAATCGEPTAVKDAPSILEMHFVSDSYEAARNPMLELRVTLDSTEQLDDGQPLFVSVTSSRGMQLEARVGPVLCDSPNGVWFVMCGQLAVTLHPGRTPADIDDLLRQVDGKFDPTNGTVFIFSGILAEALERALLHDAIRLAGYNVLVITADAELREPRPKAWHAIIPTAKEPGPPERALSVTANDTVTATHQNPDGSIVTATTILR